MKSAFAYRLTWAETRRLQESLMLKVWSNGTDTVIAKDIEDVREVIEEHSGEGAWTEDEDYWAVVPGSEKVRINNFDGHDGVQERTAAEWIEAEGRGFLCSTEY